MKRLVRILALTLGFFGTGQAIAGIPVIDAANLAQAVEQVTAWAQQYKQMTQQIQQLQQTLTQAKQAYATISGVRGMASLVNNPLLNTYLPNDWQTALNLQSVPSGFGSLASSITAIQQSAQLVSAGQTGLASGSDAANAFVAAQGQAATNRGLAQAAFASASQRITDLQTLLDKVNDAPDQKDMLDLQGRIQAAQVIVQNENTKLATMATLMQSQRDLLAQQAREISMKSTVSTSGVARF